MPTTSSPVRRATKRRHSATPLPIITERLAFKVAEVAPMLGIDKSSVYDLIHAGRLRYTRLARGRLLIPKSAIDEYLGSAVA